jgi:cupin 2 domain-containing protein
MDNLLRDLPAQLDAEQFTTLFNRPGACIERIVSTGQATPPGEWLAQPHDEWVLLVRGAAGLLIEGDAEIRLVPGDHLLIPANTRHRVAWTDPDGPTIWLAVHFGPAD